MKFLVSVAAVSLALACAPPAAAQTNMEIPQNPRITVRYEQPSLLNARKYGDIYKRLQSRKVLEQLSQVLSPLRLESDLLISVVECPDNKGPNSDYHPLRKAIRLCYEMLDFIENGAAVPPEKLPAPKNPNITVGLMPGITRGEAIVGGWVGVALHETGHAVFDIQRIPRFGKEEDAADQIAALMMLQFGNDVARTMVKVTYNLWHHWYGVNGGHIPLSFAGAHSIEVQRAANYLCIAYGGQPAAVQDLADRWLNDSRKENCASEYKQVQNAFRKTFLKSIDEGLMQKVKAMQVFKPGDLEW